jgi:hypothetical protein
VKIEDKGSSESTRLILGFDGGCFTCLELARRIDERVGDKLEVKNLRNPQLQGWRKEALGENAPWAPTLFEVNGSRVRAWTGLRMGLVLIRALGPAGTWRAMQAIGEMRPTKEKLLPGGLSRGQFLTGVGGAALAMSLLSGTGKLTRTATAHGNHHELKGSELVDKARANAKAQDVINLAGQDWSDRMQRGDVKRRCLPNGGCGIAIAVGSNCHIEIVEKGKKLDPIGYCTIVQAVRHVDFDGKGNNVLAVNYTITEGGQEKTIHYAEYDKPVKRGHDKRVKTQAKLFKYNRNTDRMHMSRLSRNGVEARRKR